MADLRGGVAATIPKNGSRFRVHVALTAESPSSERNSRLDDPESPVTMSRLPITNRGKPASDHFRLADHPESTPVCERLGVCRYQSDGRTDNFWLARHSAGIRGEGASALHRRPVLCEADPPPSQVLRDIHASSCPRQDRVPSQAKVNHDLSGGVGISGCTRTLVGAQVRDAPAKLVTGRSLQLGVLRLGLLEDRDVGVGVFPQREEILIGRLGLGGVAREYICPSQLKVCQRPN